MKPREGKDFRTKTSIQVTNWMVVGFNRFCQERSFFRDGLLENLVRWRLDTFDQMVATQFTQRERTEYRFRKVLGDSGPTEVICLRMDSRVTKRAKATGLGLTWIVEGILGNLVSGNKQLEWNEDKSYWMLVDREKL